MTGIMNSKPILGIIIGGLALTAAMAATAGAQSAASTASPVGADADAAASEFHGPTGEQLYMRVCAACHMPDGKGAEGAGFYPALADNPRLASGGYPAYVIMKGMNGMPPMSDMLTDEQAAAVVTYVRTSFGNNYPQPVTAAEMASLR